MIKKEKIVTRKEDFAKWYTSIVQNANLIVYGSIKGTMFFQPNAWSIWENIQKLLDIEFKKINVKNVALPILIPLSDLLLEKEHVEGFAPELYTVNKIGDKELSESYVIRPTSEILFCQYFKYVTDSYKNLPIIVNQWCSVMRAEKTTRPFLRNSEFHWHELHAIFDTQSAANRFAIKLANIYEKFIKEELCIPVIRGEKTVGERFAGADHTFTLEGLMQDGQMLQCATSHDLGINFAKTYDIKFQTKENTFDFVHQMSAGLSTRIIGAIIMVHADDNGLVLPPAIAPIQIAINTVGIDTQDKNIIKEINSLKKMFKNYRCEINDSDKSLGYKLSENEIIGVPIQIVYGKRSINEQIVTVYRRDLMSKEDIHLNDLKVYVNKLIKEIKINIYQRAKMLLDNSIVHVNTMDELVSAIQNKKVALAYWAGSEEDEKELKEKTNGITPRCVYQKAKNSGKCFFTNKTTKQIVLFARAY